MAVAKRRQIGGQRTEFEEEASSKGSAGILPAVSRILRDTSSEKKIYREGAKVAKEKSYWLFVIGY